MQIHIVNTIMQIHIVNTIMQIHIVNTIMQIHIVNTTCETEGRADEGKGREDQINNPLGLITRQRDTCKNK